MKLNLDIKEYFKTNINSFEYLFFSQALILLIDNSLPKFIVIINILTSLFFFTAYWVSANWPLKAKLEKIHLLELSLYIFISYIIPFTVLSTAVYKIIELLS